MMTQEELIRRIDRNRAWQWRVMSLVVLVEAFAALAAGLALLFPEWSRDFFYVGFLSVLLPFLGLQLPMGARSVVENFGRVRCPACGKRNRTEPILRNGFCTHCGTLFFVPEPTPASAFRNRDTAVADLICGLLWIAILCAFVVQVKKSSDSPLVVIADFALIQSGLLFLLLPLMWYLRTCTWGRRSIRPLDHLEETVALPLCRAKFKRSANRETWLGLSIFGLAIIPPLAVIGFFRFASTEIRCAIFSIWFFGILGLGIWWGGRHDRKVWSAVLLEQCPACRRGGRFHFFRWKSSKPHIDAAFWRIVLRNSRCPYCGCRLRFQDDPEESEK